MVVAVHRATGELLAERGMTTLRADEGGYGPPLACHGEALGLLDAAVERAGLRLGENVVYALDVAATHFFDRRRYRLASEDLTLSAEELAGYIGELAAAHPVASVEDPLAEDDWAGWQALTGELGDRCRYR